MLDFRETELAQIYSSLAKGQSLLVLGESGSGKSVLAAAIAKRFQGSTIATYGGSAKQTLMGIAEAFGIETETEEGKPRKLTAEILRAEILEWIQDGQNLLIADDAHRWPASLRYWLEDVLKAGGLLLLLADRPPAKDVFLKVPRLELEPLSADQVRTLMYAEATAQGLAINPSRFAELQQKVGGNPGLAKRVVHEEMMGLSNTSEAADHRRYIDGTPFLIAALAAVGVIRFIGIGLGDKALYVTGGVASLMVIALRAIFYELNRRNKTRLGK
jgi:energy-coupling factor transporter ATP-binding protein EcfA2